MAEDEISSGLPTARVRNEPSGLLITEIMSRVMKKPNFYLSENKDADQLCINYTADLAFVFATQILKSLFLNPKFQASSLFLGCTLGSPICVGAGWKS